MRQILTDIVDGRYAIGERLPSEVRIATRYQASRGVAREAVRALEERRVVTVTHGRGQVVLPDARWNMADSDVLLVIARSGRDPSLVLDAIETRAAHERTAARRAAVRDAALPLLRKALTTLETHAGFRALTRARRTIRP